MLVTKKQLLRGKPIKVKGIGTLVPPTISDVFDLTDDYDGVDKYSLYISILEISFDKLVKLIGLERFYDIVNENYTLFDLLIVSNKVRQILLECLSFFIAEKIKFNDVKLCFDIIDDDKIIGHIDSNNFEELRVNLLRINCINSKVRKPLKFANKRAKEVYLECQKGRQEYEKAVAKNDSGKQSLENLVSFVATKSNRYDFFNVWNLTIYQFNELAMRLNLYNQLDTYTKRWATWGKDEFDFSAWYENIEILK